MNPNESLDSIRAILDTIVDPDYNELMDLVEGLDNWLSAGGSLPKEWEWRGSGCE